MMNFIPKISVLIPVYNVEKYIRRCLDSIKDQTFKDFECILIDDGSPDNCPVICDEYAKIDSRFIVIHQKNAGVSAARNAGLDAAKGEWVCFVDSDDWVELDYLEKLYNEAEKSNADIVGCDLIREEITDSYIQEVPLIPNKTSCSSILTGEIPGWLWIKLFKKDFLNDNAIRCIDGLDMCEDTLVSLKAFFYAHRISYVHKALYHYNLYNQGSLTTVLNEKKIKQIIEINEEYKKFLINAGVYEKYKNDLRKRYAFSKLWILIDANKMKNEYFNLYSNEKLYLVRNQSFLSKIFLFLCDYKLICLAKLMLLVKTRKG